MDDKTLCAASPFVEAFTKYLRQLNDEPGRLDADVDKINNILLALAACAGSAEGVRLKGWGLLSKDLAEIIKVYAGFFGLNLKTLVPLKLPFTGWRFQITVKSDSVCKGRAWQVFLGALLSAYSLKPLGVESSNDDGDAGLFIINNAIEASDSGSEMSYSRSREYVHDMNNYLGGILSFASLIKDPEANAQRAYYIKESVQRAIDLMGKTFPKKE